MSRKNRRNSGRVTPNCTLNVKKSYIIQNCLEPEEYWNDWVDWRDCMRGYDDHKSIRNPHCWCAESMEVERWNKKNKLLLKRRKAKIESIRNQ